MVMYDIFLSFRGPDTRKKFTDHLYYALTHKGYRTFRDNDEIERGEPIKSELQKAIGDSKIFVIVLSKNYAKSTACLFELQMILEQLKKSDHFVLPVFYEVDPLEVKKQAKHLHFGKKEVTHEKVKGWSAALEEVAGMAGMVSQNQCNGEAEFIEDIVGELISQLGFWDHVKACLKRGACTITGGKHHHHHHSHHHHNPHHHHHHGQEDKQLVDYAKEAQHHKHNEHLAELAAIAAGAYAVHEKHMIKKDPAHAQMHKIEEGIAAAVAVAAGAYALHEHHEAKEAKKHMKHHHHHYRF